MLNLIKTNPIHQDDLLETLKKYGNHFITENSRVVPIEQFITLFVHKYGSFLSEWTFWIVSGEKYPELCCRNIGGMGYIFPICNKVGEYSARKLNKIEETPWAKNFYKDCPSQYKDAIEYASKPNLEVDIIHTNELGSWQYAIVVEGNDFWMDAFYTKEEALNLVGEMGWKIVD